MVDAAEGAPADGADDGALAKAASAWPELQIDPARYAAFVAERRGGASPPGLHLADLYLVCGCVESDPTALRLFSQRYLQAVADYVGHIDGSAAFADEVRQTMAERLLVGGRLADYAGRGALGGWLRVAAVRTALDLVRSRGAQARREQRHPGAAPRVADLDAEVMKKRYREDFAAAFAEATAVLTLEERHVLRLRFVDGLSLEQIAALHSVNRSTVHRWLVDAQRQVGARVEIALRARLRLSASEVHALAHLVQSQLDLHLSQLLERDP